MHTKKIVFLFLLCFLAPLRAEQTILKNTNTTSDSFSKVGIETEKVASESISSARKNSSFFSKRIKLTFPINILYPEKKIYTKLFTSVWTGISFFGLLITLIFLVKGRPFGVKLIFFLGSLIAFTMFLIGLVFSTFVLNEYFIIVKGNKYLYLFFIVVFPLLLFLVLFSLFYLRNWARKTMMAFFALCTFYNVFCLALQKDILSEYFYKNPSTAYFQETNENVSGLTPIVMWSFIFILGFVYLGNPQTKKFFERKIPLPKKKMLLNLIILFPLLYLANKLYQLSFINLTKNPNLFIKASKTYHLNPLSGIPFNFKECKALGYKFYLPSTMKKLRSKSLSMAIYIDKYRKRIFSIGNLNPQDYKFFVGLAKVRWNPILLYLKSVALPHWNWKKVALINSKNYKGIMWIGQKGNQTCYLFHLKGSHQDCINCIVSGRIEDAFLKQKNVLKIISSIEKIYL